MALRPIRFGKFGLAENPVGEYVTWTVGERQYIGEVTGTYRREFPAAIMLTVRHFNGEPAPDVHAGFVKIIGQDA